MTEMNSETQQAFMALQQNQQRLQGVMMQKDALNSQQIEIEKAAEELGKTQNDDVYKAVGPILIKSNKEELTKELADKQETIKVRLKSIENEETQIKEIMDDQQKKLQEILKPAEQNAG